MTGQARTAQSGFTLLELLIAMTVMLVVIGGTTQIMTDAMRSQTATKQMLDMNSHLRAAMDLMQRDMLQVGQGMPVGRRIGIPNGPTAGRIRRPGPGAMGDCPGVDFFPLDSTIPAITVGAGLGPPVNGECTDVITTLSADNLFGDVALSAISADGTTATIHGGMDISDDPDVDSNNLREGDLLMITKGNASVLMQVTAVQGQVVTFGGGEDDPLGLNQFDTNLGMLGTINQLKRQAPEDPDVPGFDDNGDEEPLQTLATRIRMVTYFVDVATEPAVPRLVRMNGGEQANAVGLGVQTLRLTYDIADQVNNPAGVRMDEDDLDGTGACNDPETEEPDPCSENQIRKVNILMSMTANDERARTGFEHGRQAQNTLYTQVSLRSMAFVDRYR
jgi:prepilin-type N-terminal cleavage/methylation domain-containing protein